MSVKPILMVAVAATCLFFAWRFLAPVVRFLFPGRVRHSDRPGLEEPDHQVAEQLKKLGFVYLGTRLESIGWLWRRRAAVYVLDRTVVADLTLPPLLKGSYLLTVWPDGSSALTRVGPGRTAEGSGYRSEGSAESDGIAGLLKAHRRNEAVVGMGAEPVAVENMEGRLETAARWYRRHARTEFAYPAALGGLIAAGFLSFGVYAVWLLTR